MLDLSTQLKYYKREEIQKAIVARVQDREIAVRFGDNGYGKRPEILQYPSDVLEFIKKGASSFHISEERWHRVLDLSPQIKKEDLDQNRKGWDLVLDIDCPYWELSKIITSLFIEALQEHGIKSVSVKFSGNKGFHIGVPFEAFPAEVRGNSITKLFPEGPRAIASYLLDFTAKKLIHVEKDKIIFGKRNPVSWSVKELLQITQLPLEKITQRVCSSCHRSCEKQENQTIEFLCSKCGVVEQGNDPLEEYRTCKKCKTIMEKKFGKRQTCLCGSLLSYRIFNPHSLIEVDTILLASRHLYRMPYSLHEKSGLVSIPFNIGEVLSFDKQKANPWRYIPNATLFLDASKASPEEGRSLIESALSFVEGKKQELLIQESATQQLQTKREFSKPSSALPESLFPPCIKLILAGLKDGRKRAVFILINFLRSVGWGYEQIEGTLKKWNEKNPEPLKDVHWIGQLRYHKIQKKDLLPPNCVSKQYYVEIGVCHPDSLCAKIKNPVNYAQRKAHFLQREEKSSRRKKSPSQSQTIQTRKTDTIPPETGKTEKNKLNKLTE